ncbi:MAG: ACP S-malonyltransferase [Planctomycetes bacterium]|nr:ACP S-malonyltransferase [Planctomycetota bacterium]
MIQDYVYFFPGQGAQFVGMGQALLAESSRARSLFAQGSELLGVDLAAKCLQGPEEEINSTRLSQPAIFLHSLALLDQIGEKLGGSRPSGGELFGRALPARGAAGLSLGEYSALVFAGCLEFGDALRVVVARGQFMQEACDEAPGGMTSLLGLPVDQVEKAVKAAQAAGRVGIANYNSPDQTVISGDAAAVAAAVRHAKELGCRRAIPLRVAGAYHSALMASAARKLKPLLEKIPVRPPRCPFYSNVAGRRVDDPVEIRRGLLQQVESPVRWDSIVRQVAGGGAAECLEVGPGKVIAGLVKNIDRHLKVTSVDDAGGLEPLLGLKVGGH